MDKKNIAVSVKNLNKTFIVHEREKRTIRDSVMRFYKQRGEAREIKALQNINFEIQKGEFFGIIGSNGSGKSTLLKLLIGSFKADKGSEIITHGNMIRLALGLGFDGNISARENIYINGSILGLTLREIGEVFNEIIEFAELQNFIDTPVKHFSSGMLAKLKFSIAIHTKADILLMDEIFGGVGDISFQKKSSQVFQENLLKDRTKIFVSHGLPIVSKFCDRVLLLSKGEMVALGPPEEVIPIYESMYANKETDGTNLKKDLALKEKEERKKEFHAKQKLKEEKRLAKKEKNRKQKVKLKEKMQKKDKTIAQLKKKIELVQNKNKELLDKLSTLSKENEK